MGQLFTPFFALAFAITRAIGLCSYSRNLFWFLFRLVLRRRIEKARAGSFDSGTASHVSGYVLAREAMVWSHS
jgi:hypothetical protein